MSNGRPYTKLRYNRFYDFTNTTYDMIVDGSSVPKHYDVRPPSTGDWNIERVLFKLTDDQITMVKWGGIAALSNGCLMQVVDTDGATLYDFLDGDPLKQNSDWVMLAGSDVPRDQASGDDLFAVRWTISKGLGMPLKLRQDQYLRFTIRDAMAGIVTMKMMAQGFLD